MAGFAPEVLDKLQKMGLSAPIGIGEIFFVNGGADGITTGSNANSGRRPDNAFLTIAYALTQCVGGRNDYVFCFNTYNQDTAPLIVTVGYVHIIGLNKPGIATLALELTTDDPMIQINAVGGGPLSGVEIAGFQPGGGATNGAIDVLRAAYDCWIHHCTLGHEWVQAPQDGIRLTATSHLQALLIEDCFFLGGVKGKITQYGIHAPDASAHVYNAVIRRNKFARCTSGAIAMLQDTRECIIEANKIGCASDAVAMAIDLGVNTSGNLIASNEAQHGDAVMAQNPYRDQAVADANDWMCNQVGSVMKYPEEAM